jgi:predicted ArsR family transcriptional regulator
MTLTTLASDLNITDARLHWHLQQLETAALVTCAGPDLWKLTSAGRLALRDTSPVRERQAFPDRIIDDFEDAFLETKDGLYGPDVVRARGEHRGRLSTEQTREFHDRLLHLIAEYFAPGQGDRSGIKHGFTWALTPIDLHPRDDE